MPDSIAVRLYIKQYERNWLNWPCKRYAENLSDLFQAYRLLVPDLQGCLAGRLDITRPKPRPSQGVCGLNSTC